MHTQRLFNYFAASSVVLAIIWYATVPFSNEVIGLVALLVIFMMGMPHGALDIIMLKSLSERGLEKIKISYAIKLVMLVSVYTVSVMIAFLAWMLAPTLCLIMFLIIGVSHFRHDWQQALAIPSWCLSGIVVTAPSLVYSERIQYVFEWLFLPPYHASVIALVMQFVAILCMVTILLYWLTNTIKTSVASNMIIIVMSACVLPPLIFFTLYFCIIHAVYHTALVRKTMHMKFKDLATATLPPMLGTALLFASAYWYFVEIDTLSLYYPLIFIGLFAVTCPHVLLTYFCNKVMAEKN